MIKEFLHRHGQSSDNIDAAAATERVLGAMSAGLKGEGGSLAMLSTYLYEPDLSKTANSDKKIIIDAGGTNFRSALGYFKDGKAVFEKVEKTVMPASDRELSKDEFYGAIAGNVERLLEEGGDIGFCFSYPVQMSADKDGVMCGATKELKAKGVNGTKVGGSTLQAIKKYSAKQRKVVILNDTVATLLGGTVCADKKYSAYIGYIYGTGINLAYLERVGGDGRRMIINTECGNFDGFAQGDYDKKVAEDTANPEAYRFEKMTSGKYLASVIAECAYGAESEGLVGKLKRIPFTLKDVTEFLDGGEGAYIENFLPEDRAKAKELAKELVRRAAKAGAVVNAAAAIKSAEPKGLPVAIVAEGTTFERLTGYKELFIEYLTELLAPRGITFELVKGEDANMLGSLAAALS